MARRESSVTCEEQDIDDGSSLDTVDSQDGDDTQEPSHYFDPTKITTALPLLPFDNQVGGHASFFRFSKRAICKSVTQKEQAFYEHLEAHPQLLPFTPQYLGVLNVTYQTPRSDPDAAQRTALLPQVVFEKNKHLLQDWRACHDGSLRRRHSSASSRAQKEKRQRSPDRRTRHFHEQVLREVFTPQALKERLRQVHDWQRQRKYATRNVYSPSPSLTPNANDSNALPMSFSLSDMHRDCPLNSNNAANRLSSSFSEGGRSVPTAMYASQANSPDLLASVPDASPLADSPNDLPLSIGKVTVYPRQPSMIESTTSAPLTPTMREAKRHNSNRQPPRMTLNDNSPQDWLDQQDDENELEHDRGTLRDDPEEIFQMDDDMAQPCDEKPKGRPSSAVPFVSQTTQDTPTGWQTRQTPDNPWSLQVYQRDLQRAQHTAGQSSADALVKQYLLIEDLTDGVKYPCVLDLKMGTRQYSVNATPEKVRSQTLKCERSTSKQLGARVCGMQVYKTDTGTFLFQDKYYGRALDRFAFRATLAEYLDNGHGCQIHHIPTILRKLRRLASIIRSLDDYRFYASSLLMIYDGDPTSDRKIDVRIIDFAHCVTRDEVRQHHDSFAYPPLHKGPDGGYLLGLQTLVICFEWIYLTFGGDLESLPTSKDDVFEGIHGENTDLAYQAT